MNLEVAKKCFDMNRHDDVVDTVRMGEEGWQTRYYVEKFGKTHKLTSQFYEDIAKKYVEGQLMANQPPGCAYLLPKPMQELMTSPNSPIRDFYPKRVGAAGAREA